MFIFVVINMYYFLKITNLKLNKMTAQELEHLSKEELQIIICNFYNEVDKNFSDNRQSREEKSIVIMNMFGDYIKSSRKVLQQIKK